MPRDKKLSQQRVLEAAKKEFLENGFEGASIRTIGENAGMTSAGLYRHCKDKEDLFNQIVAPLLQEMNKRFSEHKKISYDAIKICEHYKEAFDTGEIKIFLDLSKEYQDELKLLLCKSTGTRYENFINDLVDIQQKEMLANAHKIVVLKDGIVAESGSPDYLREIDGIYSHMIQLQNVSENWKMA